MRTANFPRSAQTEPKRDKIIFITYTIQQQLGRVHDNQQRTARIANTTSPSPPLASETQTDLGTSSLPLDLLQARRIANLPRMVLLDALDQRLRLL